MTIRGLFFEQVVNDGKETGAIFSPDQAYRYVLWRRWEAGRRMMIVVGLNPSTADATKNDPTITRCIGFAKREGCCGLVMLNLFAYRATDPSELTKQADPIGPDNNRYIGEYGWGNDHVATKANDETIVIAAWGAFPNALRRFSRDREIAALLPPTRCFGVTKDGHPRHLLYLRADAPLVPYLSHA